jgi:hypothetical protein
MLVRQGRDNLLVAGVPLKRGTPVQFEHDFSEEQNYTLFSRTGQVEELHVPRGVGLVRIHELMHARHTNRRRYDRVYKDIPDFAAQTLEDCRIHVCHWPWGTSGYGTPPSVKEAVRDYCDMERDLCAKNLDAKPELKGAWPDFATKLRICAVIGGMNGYPLRQCDIEGFEREQEPLARQVLRYLQKRQEAKAAKLIQTVFFPPKPPPFKFAGGGGSGKGFNTDFSGTIPVICLEGDNQPEMQIIELPHTEHVEGAVTGERRATMGSRLHRPSLRRPLLPQRLFIRRTPIEPAGTILIDASGSMGSMDNIEKWMQHAPFGQIAYYAGNGRGYGWLWIYARDGRRAAEIAEPVNRGNTVDGPALTWLLMQPAPRTFVTDREFCDAPDSHAQVARLRQLERAGEVKVVNYNNETDD